MSLFRRLLISLSTAALVLLPCSSFAQSGGAIVGSGGGGGTAVYGQFPISTGTSFSAGFAVCSLQVLPNGATITSVGLVATAASASTNWRGGIYSDSSLVVNALQNQSNLVSGVVKGMNVTSLTSAYTNSSGSTQNIWICIITDTAAFNIGTGGGNGVLLWNQGSSTFPATAPAQSANGSTWAIFGTGKVGT